MLLKFPVLDQYPPVTDPFAHLIHTEAGIDELSPVQDLLAPVINWLTPTEINSPVIFALPPSVSNLPPVDGGCSPVYPYLFICHLQLL